MITTDNITGAVLLVELSSGIHPVPIPKDKLKAVLSNVSKALEKGYLPVIETPIDGITFDYEK